MQDEYTTANGTKVKVSDPYRFLEDPQSAQTKSWVQAENEITRSFLNTCDVKEKFQRKLTEGYNFLKIGVPDR